MNKKIAAFLVLFLAFMVFSQVFAEEEYFIYVSYQKHKLYLCKLPHNSKRITDIGLYDLTIIKTYSAATSKTGWPTGMFRIKEKVKDPIWYPTVKTKAANPRLASVIGPYKTNPSNSLGTVFIGLEGLNGFFPSSLGIHGTNEPQNIGKSASRGCVRMHNKDVEELFKKVKIGTLVKLN